jgi:diguanylate cyclase (GGDEF)-like protein
MAAAAAAGTWWGALRRRSGARSGSPARDGARAKTVRLASYLLVVLAGAMIVCAVIGYAVTQHEDGRQAAERHGALRLALDEMRPVFGIMSRFDPAQLRLIERRTGLSDLRFNAEVTADGSREVQSLHDDDGRIIGWFSWAADRGLVRAMDRLWLLVGVAGVALAICAVLAAAAARRLARSLTLTTEAVRRLTNEDALTGLPNHRAMLKRLDQALADKSAAVVFALIDLDAFREIDDTLGRGGGDAVLVAIAEHLRAGLPPGALLGRFEEDEFAVMMKGGPGTAKALAEAVRTALSRPVFVERMWHVSAGIGLAQAPRDAATGEELARRANLALRAAKRDGRGAMRQFEPQIEAAHVDRRFLLGELEAAMTRQTFEVHYQPIVAADGGRMVGVEALLRWRHATRGDIPPAVFIPLAEQNGLMSRLGEFVLRRALADGVRWPGLFIAVNVSPVQMRDPWLVDLVGAVMAETGIAAARVVLEITEGVLIDNPQEAQTRLEALRALGVRIALDDFGTGYSSLSYLQKFPFDRLKIDRAFVSSLGTTANSGTIIQSIVALGHALGMSVLAEGIETDEQRVLLRLAGCDEMQGFLFARPGPAEAIDEMMARGRSAAGQGAVLAR